MRKNREQWTVSSEQDVGLPDGWVLTSLGRIATKPQYGWTSSASKDGTLRLLRTTDISNGTIGWNKVPFCKKTPVDENKFIVKEDDILVSRAGSVGVSYKIKKQDLQHKAVFASYLIRFRPFIITSFVENFLRSNEYWGFISDSQLGIAVPNVNATKLTTLPFPLPPLNEQKRIAARLDEIIPRIDKVKERLNKVPQIIKRFRQSVLTAAVTGKLTEDWREDHISGWKATCLDKQSDYITSGSRGWAKYYSKTGAIFVRAQNISSDKLILDDVAYVSLPQKIEGIRTKISKDNILITITGANVTKTALVEFDFKEAYVNQHIALVKLKNPEYSKFIYLYLIAPNAGRSQLEESAYGAGKPGLNLQNIKNVNILLPPLEEQKEIVRQVDKLFTLSDKLESHYQKAKARVDKLSSSVLAKAFRGELVMNEAELAKTEGREFESAEMLLERIKKEKAKMEAEIKAARKTKAVRKKTKAGK